MRGVTRSLTGSDDLMFTEAFRGFATPQPLINLQLFALSMHD
jgi:hypothetical protein